MVNDLHSLVLSVVGMAKQMPASALTVRPHTKSVLIAAPQLLSSQAPAKRLKLACQWRVAAADVLTGQYNIASTLCPEEQSMQFLLQYFSAAPAGRATYQVRLTNALARVLNPPPQTEPSTADSDGGDDWASAVQQLFSFDADKEQIAAAQGTAQAKAAAQAAGTGTSHCQCRRIHQRQRLGASSNQASPSQSPSSQPAHNAVCGKDIAAAAGSGYCRRWQLGSWRQMLWQEAQQG